MKTPKPRQIIGMTDLVDFPDLGWFDVAAKIDTGAFTSALHCKDVQLVREGGSDDVKFLVDRQNRGAFPTVLQR